MYDQRPHARSSPPLDLGDLPPRRSANDVRITPASPEVITSMLASFPSISATPDLDRRSKSFTSVVPPPAILDSPRQRSPQSQRSPGVDAQSPAPTEHVIDFKSPTTEQHDGEATGPDIAEAPVIRTSRPPSGFSRHTSHRPSLLQRTSSSGLRTAFSPKTPATPPSRDALSPLRPPPKDLSRQQIKSSSLRPSMEKTRDPMNMPIGTELGFEGDPELGPHNTSTTATSNAKHTHRFLAHSTPGSSTHSPSRSNVFNRSDAAAFGFSSPIPSETSPQFILQGIRVPAIKAAEDELSPVVNNSFIPDRRSSLRQSEEQPARTKRRSRFARRVTRGWRDAPQDTKDPASESGAVSVKQKDPDLVQPVDGLRDEDDSVVRRIKELKAAKEQREKSQADRELSNALAATLPTFDPSLPSQLVSPPVSPENQVPATPTPRANKRHSDISATRRLRISVDGEERQNKRESFLLSPTTPDAMNDVSPSNLDEPPPLPPPDPALQSISLIRPLSHDQVVSRPTSRNKRWSTPEGDKLIHKRDLSGKQHLKSLRRSNHPKLVHDRSNLELIEDSVQAFLGSSRLSQTIPSSDSSRRISFSEVGDPHGYTVICCVGMGLTRYITAFYEELARTLKLRLVTLDRPGVGDSGAYTDSSYGPLQWPDDLQILCTHLSISSFSLLAHSAGAIYALATALKMPSHVRGKIHLLAPWIPPSQMVAQSSKSAVNSPASGLPRSQRFLRLVPTPFLKLTNSTFLGGLSRGSPKSSPKSTRKSGEGAGSGRASKLNSGRPSIGQRQISGTASTPTIAAPARPSTPHLADMVDVPSDHSIGAAVLKAGGSLTPNQLNGTLSSQTVEEEAAKRRAYDAALTPAVWTLATKNSNPAVDLVVCLERNQRIGFRYADVDERVVIHHGTKDNRVPLENIKWLGNVMRNVELRVVDGEGHGLMGNANVMGQVLEEISKEREEDFKAERKDRERATPRKAMLDDPFIRQSKSQPQSRRPTMMMARDSGRG